VEAQKVFEPDSWETSIVDQFLNYDIHQV